MESISIPQIHHSHNQPFHLTLNHRRSSSPSTLFSSISFRPLPLPSFSSSSFKKSSIRASSSPSSPSPSQSPKNPFFYKTKNALTHMLQTLNPLFSFLVEPACVAIVAAALVFTRRSLLNPEVTFAPVAPPPEIISNDENESVIEEQLINDSDDTEALKSLVEVKIRERKIDEAIRVIDRLIELEPEELELPLLKAQMYIHNGEHELAMNGFEDVLKKDPFCVEAFHGLMMATFESNKPTQDLLKRVEEAVELCKVEKRDLEVRDLKLLIAQVKVIEGDFYGAVKVYEEVEKEEPSDFRPYLCQGIVYTMLKKKDEAEKQFEKFRELVPEDHPYKEYFEDNTMVFSQKLEMQGTAAKNENA